LAIVLGCPSITNMDVAVRLYHAGLAPRLLITGHGPGGEIGDPEWRQYRDHGLAGGIPERAMLVETRARNTRENFIHSEAIIAREIGWTSLGTIAIITKPLHTRRALMTARRYFPAHVQLIMQAPADPGSIQPESWWQTQYGRDKVLGELRRIGEYGLLNHLAGF
jgi:uncharacterized SAM-binding protein YcdF (DUF218 family)